MMRPQNEYFDDKPQSPAIRGCRRSLHFARPCIHRGLIALKTDQQLMALAQWTRMNTNDGTCPMITDQESPPSRTRQICETPSMAASSHLDAANSPSPFAGEDAIDRQVKRIPLLTFWWALACLAVNTNAARYDLVIRHGRVADGTGNPAYFADVAIKGGRIVAMGKVSGDATAEIDARGLIVAPGFIDVHTQIGRAHV